MKSYEKVPYRPFKSDIPRTSTVSELETLGELIPALPQGGSAYRYQTDMGPGSKRLDDQPVDFSSVVIETHQRHLDTDRDIDEVLDTPNISRDNEAFLQLAWKERVIRKLDLRPQESEADKARNLAIKILRIGGDFQFSRLGRPKGLMHVKTNDDLTLLMWHAPRTPKKCKDINVFELLGARLEGMAIALKTIRDDKEIILTVTEANRVELLAERSLELQEKADLWFSAFDQLVKMQLQPSVYRRQERPRA